MVTKSRSQRMRKLLHALNTRSQRTADFAAGRGEAMLVVPSAVFIVTLNVIIMNFCLLLLHLSLVHLRCRLRCRWRRSHSIQKLLGALDDQWYWYSTEVLYFVLPTRKSTMYPGVACRLSCGLYGGGPHVLHLSRNFVQLSHSKKIPPSTTLRSPLGA